MTNGNGTDKRTTLGAAFGSFISGGAQILSGFLGLAGLAYLFGYLTASAYFSYFHADWLIGQLSPSTLLKFSVRPVIGLVTMGFFVGSMAERSWPRSTFWKLFLWGAGPFLALSVVLVFVDRGSIRYIPEQLGINVLSAAAFVALVLFLQESVAGGERTNLSGLAATQFLVVGVLLNLPRMSGDLQARQACRDGLPRVVASLPGAVELGLIYSAENQVFAVETAKKCGHGPVHVLNMSEVARIEPVRKGKKSPEKARPIAPVSPAPTPAPAPAPLPPVPDQ